MLFFLFGIIALAIEIFIRQFTPHSEISETLIRVGFYWETMFTVISRVWLKIFAAFPPQQGLNYRFLL